MQQEHHQGRVWSDISEFSTMGILSWILLCHRDLSCASRKLSSIFGLRSLDASSSSPVVKNKNVSYCMHVNSSPTLCDPMDCSPSGSSVHGILQTRILEWVAISYPRGSSWPRDWTHVSWVSCTGREILHCGATWEALVKCLLEREGAKPLGGITQALPWPAHHLSQCPLVSPCSPLGPTPCQDGIVCSSRMTEPRVCSTCDPLPPALWARWLSVERIWC